MTERLDGTGGPHVLVADVAAPHLDDDDRHHLARVLRLRTGEPFTVGDGHGSWRACRFGDPIEPVGAVRVEPRPTETLTVAVALVKGSRPELVVQKLTEIGVDEIALFAAERSVVRWDADKVLAQRARLDRVVGEAAMQCRRAWLPRLHVLADLAGLAARPDAVRADRDGGPVRADHRCVLVGPEGGWTDAERRLVPMAVRLGPHVLRAETAAIAAGVLLAAATGR